MVRWLGLILVAGFLGGCGSTQTVTTVETVTTSAPSAPPASSSISTNPQGTPVYHYTMPASSSPTHCSVWLQGHLAQILFSSSSVDVTPACDSWVSASAASGELWIKNEVSSEQNQETIICSLQSGPAVAEIEDEQGGTYGQEACTRLIAGGWTEQGSTPVP